MLSDPAQSSPLVEDAEEDTASTESVESDGHSSEEDIATYLVENPEFFSRHAHILETAQIATPHAGRAVSLQTRQLEVLREKNETTLGQMAELMRTVKENEIISERLAQWTRQLLLVRDAPSMPSQIVDGLQNIFNVPCVALRIWNVNDDSISGNDAVFFEAVDASTLRMTNDLTVPYCGLRGDIAQARWLDDGGVNIRSVSLLSLRSGMSPTAFGLIVLGSPDPDRFQNGMGTEFLERIGQTASAALSRLTHDAGSNPETA